MAKGLEPAFRDGYHPDGQCRCVDDSPRVGQQFAREGVDNRVLLGQDSTAREKEPKDDAGDDRRHSSDNEVLPVHRRSPSTSRTTTLTVVSIVSIVARSCSVIIL